MSAPTSPSYLQRESTSLKLHVENQSRLVMDANSMGWVGLAGKLWGFQGRLYNKIKIMTTCRQVCEPCCGCLLGPVTWDSTWRVLWEKKANAVVYCVHKVWTIVYSRGFKAVFQTCWTWLFTKWFKGKWIVNYSVMFKTGYLYDFRILVWDDFLENQAVYILCSRPNRLTPQKPVWECTPCHQWTSLWSTYLLKLYILVRFKSHIRPLCQV